MPAPLMCVRVVPVLSRVKCLCPAPPPIPTSPTDGFTSEGEILEISDIQRGQAGEYECVTHNGVNSAPDSRRVLVTVNCEHREGHRGPTRGAWGGGVCSMMVEARWELGSEVGGC